MVIKIHQTKDTSNALLYNEQKVEQGHAQLFHSQNTQSENPFNYSKEYRLNELLAIEAHNPRVKNKCLHISLNPSIEDAQELNEADVKAMVEKLMNQLGYGQQPYFVYQHGDIDRMHYHIVSTRIDQHSYKKISDANERRKVQEVLKSLSEQYGLNNSQDQETLDFRFSARSRNIKESLENLFAYLNGMEGLSSKEEYQRALHRFNVEIRASGRGHVVVVTDGMDQVIRYPIRLSKFINRPIYLQKEQEVSRRQSIGEGKRFIPNRKLDEGLILKAMARALNEGEKKDARNPRLKTEKRKRKGRKR